MGYVTVEGLGRVEIAGDTPTKEEARLILKASRRVGADRMPPPVDVPVTDVPAGPDDDDDVKSGFGRAFVNGLSSVARRFSMETPEALEEAIPGIGYVLPQTSFRRITEWVTGEDIHEGINQEWKDWEQDLYAPSVEGVEEALESPEKLLTFVAESGVNALPGMALAMASLPAAAFSQVGNVARQRAANRGDDKVNVADVAIGGVVGVGSAYMDKVVGRGVLSPTATGKTAVRRVATTAAKSAPAEFLSGAGEAVGEQIGTREEGLYGVDVKEALLRGAGEALVGAGIGGGGRATVEVARGPASRLAATKYAEELAGAKMPGGVAVAAQDLDPDVAREAARAESIAVEAADAPVAVAEVSVPRRPGVEPSAPSEAPPSSAKENAELAKLIADPAAPDEAVHAKAMSVLAGEYAGEAGVDPRALAAKHAHMDPVMLQAADELGMSKGAKKALTARDRMRIADVLQAAEASGMKPTMGGIGEVNQPARLINLIESINKRDHTPSVVEQAAIHAAVMLNKRAHQDILDAVKGGKAKSELSMEELAARLTAVNKNILDAALALRTGGSALSNAFRYRQFVANKIESLVDAKAEAMLKAGGQLTAKQTAKIEKLWRDAAKLEGAASRARKKAEHERRVALRLYRSAQKSRNTRAMDKAEIVLEKAEDDLVKAAHAARRAEREKAQAATTVTTPRLFRWYKKLFGATLVLSSSGDNSALGRQAIGLVLQNPVMAIKTLPIAFQLAPWSRSNRAFALRTQKAIMKAEMQKIRDLAGLELTEIEGLSNVKDGGMLAREELFMFRALESGALGNNLIIPSQNAFGLTLNLLRAANFDHGARLLAKAHGADPTDIKSIRENVPAADLKGLALLINASTGRGDWVSGQGALASLMRNIMFAPRFTMSRFETPYRAMEAMLGVGKFKGISKKARRQFQLKIAKNLAFLVGLGMLSWQLGDDDPEENISNFVDPRSGDFLKLRVGNYHVDLTGGMGSTWRYVLPLLVGGERPSAAMGQMVRNKVAPLIGAFETIRKGTDFRGRKVTMEAMKTDKAMEEFFNTKINNSVAIALHRGVFPAMGAATPITVQNAAEEAWDAMTGKEKKDLERILPVILDAFGVGARHYKPTKRGRKKTLRHLL